MMHSLSARGWQRWIVTIWLLASFAQVTLSMRRTSITLDEPLHIASGYSILRTGDYRLIEEHPPLVKLIAAWPLLLVPDLADPRELSGWELDVSVTDSVRLVRASQGLLLEYEPLDRLVFAARLSIALLALLLGALAFRWGTDRFGSKAGVLALFLLTFDPNILAHAGVATTDLGATFFILLALFSFQRFLRRPTCGRWLLAGLTLGLAQGAKLSAMLLLPTQGILILAYVIWGAKETRMPLCFTLRKRRSSRAAKEEATDRETRWRVFLHVGIAYAGILVLAALVLWGLYGFEVGPVPTLGYSLPAASHAVPWLRLREHMREGHAAFLMGQVSHQGWWYYFPVALALKTPLPILLFWLAALVALLLRPRRQWLDEVNLVLFPVLYLGFSLQSSLNIGYRHLLPILPFLAIFAGRLAPLPNERGRQLLVAALGLWLVVGTLFLFPHYLAYFNELAGGPDGGYRYLVDSNTDWGQALKELVRYQKEQDTESVHLSMFTFLDPAIYGVRYQPLTPMHGNTPAVFPSRFNPSPGDYVISTTTLQGIPLADPEMFDWFRQREPDARIGHVMFLYRVPDAAASFDWVAQCTNPVVPLPPEAIVEGFGRSGLRRVYYDCTKSWLIPGGGQVPGWYVLFRDTARSDDAFIQEYLGLTRLSFEQTRSRELPPFAVFEATGIQVAPAHVQTVPVEVGDLRFLGHTVADQSVDRAIEVRTFWRVQALPTRPLSLMLHLVGPGGAPVIVGDGMGVPIENWRVDDVIVQRHRLELAPDAPAGDYALYTGAYWLDTLDRWTVINDGQAPSDQLSLAPIHVTVP